jgi:hypothetical protein
VTRVYIVVEGFTEESFIKNVLAPALQPKEIYAIPIVLGQPGHKGGNVQYQRVKKDVLLLLKQQRTFYCSTMFDLYGLGTGFPGTQMNANLSGTDKAVSLEKGMHHDICTIIPALRPEVRFIPYIQVHEYEGLLFSDGDAFASALGKGSLAGQIKAIRNEFLTPEDINDGPSSSPSKRVIGLYPSYNKKIEGTGSALAVGLAKMRQECPHFNSWLELLESLRPLS